MYQAARNPKVTVKVLVPTGCLGYGFVSESLENGMAIGPDIVGMDAGSSDPGPYYLGSGRSFLSRDAVYADLERIIPAAKRAGVPVVVGTSGGAGGEPHLQWTFEILRDVATAEGVSLKVALVHAEQNKEYVKGRLNSGKVNPLGGIDTINEDVIDRASRIVGLMGVEPFQEALKEGVDVVLAGRACDAAIFASHPIARGIPRALALHAAKIIQCGNGAVESRVVPDGMFGILEEDRFSLRPLLADTRCTPQSVISLSLYESADPYRTPEPAGVLDTESAWYRQELDNRSVSVGGSRFYPSETYTIRLEASERVGYRTIMLGGIRDPVLLDQIESFVEKLKQKWRSRISETLKIPPAASAYHTNVRLYGMNAVMGEREPVKRTGHEVGILLEAVGPSQREATTMLDIGQYLLLHHPVEGWSGQVSNVAYPYSPSTIEMGPVYGFSLNHTVEPSDPLEMFPIEIVAV